MKMRRTISLLLTLVLALSSMGTVALAAESDAAYEAEESFQVSTDAAPAPYYMGAAQPDEPGKPYYFLKGGGTTNNIDGYSKSSLPTTSKVWESTPVYIEQVSAGYRMYYMKGENKSYIALTSGGATNNQKDQTDAKNTFTWDAENKVFFQMDTVNGESQPVKYILAITTETDGTTRDRITAQSWADYLASEDSGTKKVYPVRLYTSESVGIRKSVDVDTTPVSAPMEGTPYFLCVRQGDVGENGTLYYWIGRVVDTAAALFLEVTTDNGKAAVVFLESTGTGWKMTQMLDGEKKYLYVYRKGSDMALGLVGEAKYATEFRWDEEYNTLIADYFGTDIFMGVNTDMNDDGTVKTAFTKIKPLKTTVLGLEHRYSSFLVAVPEEVDAEVPPPPETEPTLPTDPGTEGNEVLLPQPAAENNTGMIWIIVAAILMAGGIALVVLDVTKYHKNRKS